MAKRQVKVENGVASIEATPENSPRIQIPKMPGYELVFQKEVLQSILDGAIMFVGIDVGYGKTKGLAWGFKPIVSMPTIYGYERDLGYEMEKIAAEHEGDFITTDDGEFFVGELAAKYLAESEQFTLRGRTNANAVRRLMILATLAKMLTGVKREEGEAPIRVRLATGLPVEHMKDASDLKKALVGRFPIMTDQARIEVEIEYVSVMPQPTGTIQAYCLLPDGNENPRYVYKKIAVIDNGQWSVDISTEEDGTHIQAESGGRSSGFYLAYERVAERYKAQFDETPSQRLIESILMNGGRFNAFGSPVDWCEETANDLRPMRDATLNLAREKLGRAVQHDLILNVGGPAPLVKEIIAKEYKHAIMPPLPQITNALGYLHYAAFAAQED